MGGAAAVVDVAPVRLDRRARHLGAKPSEDLGCDPVGGAVRAVEQNVLAAQVEALEPDLAARAGSRRRRREARERSRAAAAGAARPGPPRHVPPPRRRASCRRSRRT